MKRLIVVLMILCPVAVMGQTTKAAGQTTKAPAVPMSARVTEFSLTVHVISSKIEESPGTCSKTANGVVLLNVLHAVIQGKKYLLAIPIPGKAFPYGLFDRSRPVLIEPGDYPAGVVEDKQPNPGQVERRYELKLANGKTVDAYLWGMSG